jgi:hypothetical protein
VEAAIMTERIDIPRPGFYRCRLIRGGMMVPVEIYFGRPMVNGELLDRSPRLCAVVDGHTDREDYDDAGTYLGRVPLDPLLDDIWTHCCGDPIDRAEYEFMTRRRVWAKEHDADHPAANTRRPIDIRKLRPAW